MQGFVGRERELGQLSAFMDNPGVRGLAVYGLRQVGKTELLKRFARDRRSVYIQLDRGSESAIVESAMSQIRMRHAVVAEPTTIPGLMEVLGGICSESPTLIILDEYPYMSRSAEHADTVMQRFMDGVVKDTGSKVIICGSQLSSMLEFVQDRGNPLYRRFGMSMEVRPMGFEDTCLLHPGMDDRDLMRMHMMLGGMPGDHLIFQGRTFDEVVADTLLAEGMPFGNLARSRIGSETGRTDENVAIVRAVAKGRTTLKEISGFSGIPESTCSGYIGGLERIGILGHLHPMAGAPSRKRYYISDGLVAIWYTVFNDLYGSMAPDDATKRREIVSNRMETFFGHRFEFFCTEWMSRNYACNEIGTWWGVGEDEYGERVGVDIDIVADVTERGKRGRVYCECKFRNRPAKAGDLDVLVRRAEALDGAYNLVFFSAGGFERGMVARARECGAALVGTDELMGRVPAPSLLFPGEP